MEPANCEFELFKSRFQNVENRNSVCTRNKVTRLGEFLPIGQLLNLGSFFKFLMKQKKKLAAISTENVTY
jgi:hypothetical protein